jgi:hypothetical protein
VVIAGQAWLAVSLSLNPVWLFPVISAVLLIASVAVYLPKRPEPSPLMRSLGVSLIGILVIANAVSLIELVRNIFVGVPGLSPVGLLLVGIVLWVVNIAIFALVYTDIAETTGVAAKYSVVKTIEEVRDWIDFDLSDGVRLGK